MRNRNSALDENECLPEKPSPVAREKSIADSGSDGLEASSLIEINRQLMERLAEMEERVMKLEGENREFADLYVNVQEQYVAVTNLYVASHRLHATQDPAQVMQIIMEILVELVGADEFGIFLLDEKKRHLKLVAGDTVRKRLPSELLPAGEGVIGEVATSGEPFFFEPKNPAEHDGRLPLAAIPLNIKHKTEVNPLGVIVIYDLLSQKSGFSATDHQILELLAGHAATALVSARLYDATDRRLKTIEGFMQLFGANS